MIDLVALDVAGTTIDEGDVVYAVLRECVESRGAVITDTQFSQWMGTAKRSAIAALLELGGVQASDEQIDEGYAWFLAELQRRYAEQPPVVFPGVAEAVAELRSRGIKVALTTGFSTEITGPLLEGVGWSVPETLDAVVCASEAAAGRPAPYLIHRAMELTGAQDVRRVLAAGDTIADLLAAENAGVIGVGVLTGAMNREALSQLPHTHIVESVADLPALPECQPE